MKKIAFQRYLNWNKSISTFFQALCFPPYRILVFWVEPNSGSWRDAEETWKRNCEWWTTMSNIWRWILRMKTPADSKKENGNVSTECQFFRRFLHFLSLIVCAIFAFCPEIQIQAHWSAARWKLGDVLFAQQSLIKVCKVVVVWRCDQYVDLSQT